jgi:hypothetical protein
VNAGAANQCGRLKVAVRGVGELKALADGCQASRESLLFDERSVTAQLLELAQKVLRDGVSP